MTTKHMDVAESIRQHLRRDRAHVSIVTERTVPNDDRTAGIIYAWARDSDRIFRVTVETVDDGLGTAAIGEIGYEAVPAR